MSTGHAMHHFVRNRDILLHVHLLAVLLVLQLICNYMILVRFVLLDERSRYSVSLIFMKAVVDLLRRWEHIMEGIVVNLTTIMATL